MNKIVYFRQQFEETVKPENIGKNLKIKEFFSLKDLVSPICIYNLQSFENAKTGSPECRNIISFFSLTVNLRPPKS